MAQVEANIDYPEYDDVEDVTTNLVREKDSRVPSTSRKSFGYWPNEGKILRRSFQRQSLVVQMSENLVFLTISYEEKVIVTDIEGTTRDVEEYVNIKGVPLS